jgi:predicted nuclease of predicted toxin-antitoxin system
MQFKVDENLPSEVAELLHQAGYDAITVVDQHLGGEADANIASVCQREGRALVTLDTGFADIRAYPPEQYSGLIVLRLRRQDKFYVLRLLARVTQQFSKEPLDRHLWIVEEGQIRVRG